MHPLRSSRETDCSQTPVSESSRSVWTITSRPENFKCKRHFSELLKTYMSRQVHLLTLRPVLTVNQYGSKALDFHYLRTDTLRTNVAQYGWMMYSCVLLTEVICGVRGRDPNASSNLQETKSQLLGFDPMSVPYGTACFNSSLQPLIFLFDQRENITQKRL